jgi:hypothetical protein
MKCIAHFSIIDWATGLLVVAPLFTFFTPDLFLLTLGSGRPCPQEGPTIHVAGLELGCRQYARRFPVLPMTFIPAAFVPSVSLPLVPRPEGTPYLTEALSRPEEPFVA